MLEYCIQGKSCRRALLYSYFDSNVMMSRVVHVVMFVLSLVCVLIVSVIVSPSAYNCIIINMYIMDGYNVVMQLHVSC